MEFGLVLTQFTDRWDHVVADARLAEEAGLDSVWLVDHLLSVRDPQGPVLEAWTALAAVAALTERVRLGHLVNCVSFRNPGLLAKMAATLDHISGGRLDLGLGAGWYEAEYRAFGWDFPSAADRRRYFEAYLEALVRLLSGEEVSYDRNGVHLEAAVINPPPLQRPHPPIVVGAARPHMLAITGRLADEWNCPAGLLPHLEEPQAAVRRSAGGREVRTSIQVPVAVGRTPEEAAAAHSVAATHLAWMGDIDEVGIVGTLDAASERVEAYRRRGVSRLLASVPGTRMRPEFIAAYGQLARQIRQMR